MRKRVFAVGLAAAGLLLFAYWSARAQEPDDYYTYFPFAPGGVADPAVTPTPTSTPRPAPTPRPTQRPAPTAMPTVTPIISPLATPTLTAKQKEWNQEYIDNPPELWTPIPNYHCQPCHH